ncbi:MAG: permease [Candidatus Saccharimonadales bacterium]
MIDIFAPLQWIADWLTYSIFNIAKNSSLGNSVNFFIYDSIKIILMLATIIFVVSYVRSYFPPEKTKKLLSSTKYPVVNNLLAALFGIVTPFCSCSAIPLFIGFIEAGVPLGATLSFLISAPMVNEIALVLLWGLFGWKIALIYIVSGVTIATVAGWVLGRLKLEKWVENFVYQSKSIQTDEKKLTKLDRLEYAKNYAIDIIKKIWIFILIGVGLGSLMHGYAPSDLLVEFAGPNNFFAVPIATLIGIPLYSNAAGTIPIVSVLIDKGMPIGTALAFMMAVTALSLPEFIILKKVLKTKLIIIYALIVGLGIIFVGYLFNIIIK